MDQQFLPLLTKIKHDRRLDLSEYKLATIQRRINRRLLSTHTNSYQEYALLLDREPQEYQKLIEALTIKVSWFFRDPAVFEILSCWIWPQILKQKKARGDFCIRIWSAGCADGEEAYSLAILLAELLKEEADRWEVSIFATDIDQQSLSRCKEGAYPEAAILEVKKGMLDHYFIQSSSSGDISSRLVRVKDWLKEWITFASYDLLCDQTIAPVESVVIDFDMIVCRNVLMYFSQSAQKKVLGKFFSALAESEGYLVLGKNEWISADELAYQWKEIRKGFRIYQKQTVKEMGSQRKLKI